MSKDTSKAAQDGAETKSRVAVPWNPWLGLLFVLLLYYASQIVGGTLLSLYPILRHWSHAEAMDWVQNSPWAQFSFVVLVEAVTVGAVYLFVKRYGKSLASIGLKRPRWADLAYGLAALPAYFIIYLFAVNLATHLFSGFDVNQQQQIGFDGTQGGLPLILAFISLVVLPPLAEEIMVRGFLYSSLKKAMPVIYAVILTSVLFAVAHLPEGGASGPLYIAALDTFILSLVLIYLREITGSLWASITLHAAKNFVAFYTLFILHIR
jgi:membrane protease YdiL (CAAX protease family)